MTMCLSPTSSAPDPAAELLQRRRIWESKYAIRACYRGWLDRLRPFIVPGPSLEVGAGSGDMKSLWPELIATDLVPTPFVDLVADGMRLPVADGSLSNLLVIDLLHHLADPHVFFDEADRVLRPGGRILAIEPYITPLSWLAYRMMHHEDIWLKGYQKPTVRKDPWQGNLAMANVVFGRQLGQWSVRHPRLSVMCRRHFSVLDFQLAAGYKPYALVPWRGLYDVCLKLDRLFDPLGAVIGFRVLLVIEKQRTAPHMEC